ncbi:hypothetical protein F5Y13DRAFT_98361 [Hypoxylon sp. FL1857]|nr:hypothetical protein F5Y13DRAFT_98361 [Hypoxylon sp. FL1857]
MCVITKVHCPRCDVVNEAGMAVCQRILALLDAASMTHHNYASGESILVHCEDLVWPPVGPMPMVSQLCDECMFERRPDDNFQSHWAPSVEAKVLNDAGEIEDWIVRCQSNSHWPARLSEAAHRELTLRIPCCKLCREPRFFFKKTGENTNKDEDKYAGIEGIQLEINSILWKWISTIRGKHPITVRLSTGFCIKPCRGCIDLESMLRGKVMRYLEACNETEAWGVWHWLTLRAIPQVSFWENKTELSDPSHMSRPDKRSFHAIMTAGWQARTGVDFADAILSVSDGVDHYDFAYIKHKEPFTDLAQWNELAGVVKKLVPTIKRPATPIDLDKYQIEYDVPNSRKPDGIQSQEVQTKKPGVNGHLDMVGEPKRLRIRFVDPAISKSQ